MASSISLSNQASSFYHNLSVQSEKVIEKFIEWVPIKGTLHLFFVQHSNAWTKVQLTKAI